MIHPLKVECARCGYVLDEAESWGDGEIGDTKIPSFCSRTCYDAGAKLPEGHKVEIDDTRKAAMEYLPCGCSVDYRPLGSGGPAFIDIVYCETHQRAEVTEARLENTEADVENLRDKLAEYEAEREEMLDRLGMTEHEWSLRRTWVGSPQLALVGTAPAVAKPKRARRKS